VLDEESSEIWCHLRAYVVSLRCECVELFKYCRGFTVLYKSHFAFGGRGTYDVCAYYSEKRTFYVGPCCGVTFRVRRGVIMAHRAQVHRSSATVGTRLKSLLCTPSTKSLVLIR
jgi:hypothetical protein